MDYSFRKAPNTEFLSAFTPKSSAAKVFVPLLDALNWQGDNAKLMEAAMEHGEAFDFHGLIEVMTNLNFTHYEVGKFTKKAVQAAWLPAVVVKGHQVTLVLTGHKNECLIFDGEQGLYLEADLRRIKGTLHIFKAASDQTKSLLEPQENWFFKLLYRFRKSFATLIGLTFTMTLLDLLMPTFIAMIYSQLTGVHSMKTLWMILIGVSIYLGASLLLSHSRGRILNYMSSRMGAIISQMTFTRLAYLSPSYTETASISAQISRVKDFEGLKHFIASGTFIEIFDLVFSVIYIIAIFVLGGWLGFIPVGTLAVLIVLGIALRPIHKMKLETLSEANADYQQLLLEILRNTDDIKTYGAKGTWIERYKDQAGKSIWNSYQLSSYVSLSNTLSYFITNVSVLIMIYGGVLKVFEGQMSTGILIGVMMLYMKSIKSIRGVFSLAVQFSSLSKSVAQINRFMKLPQDNKLETNMMPSRQMKGQVRFSDVSIRYTSEANPALVNVNFATSPGKILGISGHDGAGKSTILKLILGMYKPQAGRILIDQANIKQLEPLSLRRAIAYAPEKDILLSGTIREHFLAYNATLSDAKIEAWVDAIGLKPYFERFGYSLDTVMDQTLIRQMPSAMKKLMNLARAMTRDTNLLLVDEPENHLEAQQLEQVMAVIERKARFDGVGVIVSTKDNRVLKYCDDFLELNQGRLQ